ncbi:MAG TPA: hypothetical protein VHL11_19565, partial [Phototrophicaceae bacterium]|nr:hypothetical protein [Phototrophicaceae bacterium]
MNPVLKVSPILIPRAASNQSGTEVVTKVIMDNTNQPTQEQWRTIFALAEQVKQLKPWAWMEESDIFGVQLPDSDQVGFVSVMGMGGEHFAVSIYRGVGALFALWDFIDDFMGANPMDLMNIPQIMIDFSSRKDTAEEDRAIYKLLKLKFRGNHDWITFRDYSPGFLPWFITSDQIPLITVALEQLLEVAPRFKVDAKTLYLDAPDNYFEERAELMEMERQNAFPFNASAALDMLNNQPDLDFADSDDTIEDDDFEDDFDSDDDTEEQPEVLVMVRIPHREGDALIWQDEYRDLSKETVSQRQVAIQIDSAL